MKKSVSDISSFFLILGLCWISVSGNSQDLKLNKKEKKEARRAERLKDYEALGALLESRKFVFAADRIQGTTGVKISHIIHIDGLRFFTYLENPKNTSGENSGVWNNTSPSIGNTGLFLEGDIGHWELSKNLKNLSYSITFEVQGSGSTPGGNFEITMNINNDKSASLEIDFKTGSTVYNNYLGHIKPY